MRALSLFSSAGIAEMGLKQLGIDVKVANELLPKRAELHRFWHPDAEMIEGSITDEEVKNELINQSKRFSIEFVLCTPPCQGVSLIGKNKNQEDYIKDERNYLLIHALEVINVLKPSYILIENVPRYLNLSLPWKGELLSIEELLIANFSEDYFVESAVYNATEFGIAQSRDRAFIKIFRKGLSWPEPQKTTKKITLRDAIGNLPSLESGEVSKFKNHYARRHSEHHVLCMKHTPTGKSALDNEIYYPRNQRTGKKVKAYSSSYKRMKWDEPAPTITMRNDAISSQTNVHPGRKLADGTYSDARVLTLRELFILSSIDPDIEIPKTISESQVRYMIGEAVPPKMIEEIVKPIMKGR